MGFAAAGLAGLAGERAEPRGMPARPAQGPLLGISQALPGDQAAPQQAGQDPEGRLTRSFALGISPNFLDRPRRLFDLYVILDIYSRYAPGWLVAPGESAELAEAFIVDTIARVGVPWDRQELSLYALAPRGDRAVSPVALPSDYDSDAS